MCIFLPSHVTHYNYVIHYRYLSDSLFSTQLPKVMRTLIFTFAFISFPRIRDLIFFFLRTAFRHRRTILPKYT